MNVGKRPGLTGKAKPMPIPEESATVVNIVKEAPPMIARTYGNFTIHGCVAGRQQLWDRSALVMDRECEPGEEWAGERVHAARAVVDFGKEFPRNEFIVHAVDIANDLALNCNGDLWGIGSTVTGEVDGAAVRGFAGVFVCSGDLPTAEELQTARGLLRSSDHELISRGHKEFAQFGPSGIQALSDSFKHAARRQRVEAEWIFDVKDLPNCPACAAQLRSPKAAVCSACGAIIDAEKAAEYGLVQMGPAAPQPARRPAKPKTKAAKSAAAA